MANTISKLGIGRLWLNDTEVTATADEINSGVDGLTATAAELNQLDASANISKMSASTAVAAAAETYKVSTLREGNVIHTTIYVDITGLKAIATDGHIIGDTGASHIGQVTTSVNGIIFAGRMSCAEVPGTASADIDLYEATVGTGAYNSAIGDLTEHAVVTAGDAWTAVAVPKAFIATIPANSYLYLTNGAGANAGTYTAGKFIIEMWGLVA